jgi:hypothetical protein
MSKNGRPPHEPTDELKTIVRMHSIAGTEIKTIARIIGVSIPTLYKNYRTELEDSQSEANAVIAGKLFQKAKDGDTACMMFWLKTRAKWSEVQKIEHSGQIDSETKMIVLPANSREFDIDMKVEAIESKDNSDDENELEDDDTEHSED